jgi:hypothetical protein
MAWQETKAMANYVLSYAFSDQVFLTYMPQGAASTPSAATCAPSTAAACGTSGWSEEPNQCRAPRRGSRCCRRTGQLRSERNRERAIIGAEMSASRIREDRLKRPSKGLRLAKRRHCRACPNQL